MRFKKFAVATALLGVALFGPTAIHTAQARTISVTASEGGLSHAAEECIHFLEAGESVDRCVEAPNPILPATDELVWGTIAFVILFAGLSKVALPAIKKTMAARSAKIEGDLGAAASAKTEADKMLGDYKAQLADAKSQSDRIIDEARQQAESVRKDLIARAESDAQAIRTKASEDLGAQAERLKSELETHVKSLSLDLAEKVVGSNMNRETNSALVDRYIAELAAK